MPFIPVLSYNFGEIDLLGQAIATDDGHDIEDTHIDKDPLRKDTDRRQVGEWPRSPEEIRGKRRRSADPNPATANTLTAPPPAAGQLADYRKEGSKNYRL